MQNSAVQYSLMQLKRKVSFASHGGSQHSLPGQEGDQPRSLPLPTLTRQTSLRSPSPSKSLVKVRTPPVLMSAVSPATITASPSQHSHHQHQPGLNRNTNLLELSQMFQQMQSVVTNRGAEISSVIINKTLTS